MRSRPVVRVAWAGSAISVLAMVAWARRGDPLLFAAAAATFVFSAATTWATRRRESASSQLQVALFINLILLLAGGVFTWQFHRIASEWEQLSATRDAQARQVLDRRMQTLIEQGRRTAALASTAPVGDTIRTFAAIDELRVRSNVDAVALFGEASQLIAWSGEHRGRIPDRVRALGPPVQFIERPLYSYLYFSEPLQNGAGVAIAAVLLDVALPQETIEEGFAQEFRRLAGRKATFISGPGAPEEYNIVVDGDTIAHARIEPLSQAEWRREVLRVAQQLVIALVIPAFILLTLAWLRAPLRPTHAVALVPALIGITAAVIAPIGPALGLDRLFSPGLFVLPGPGDITLGTLFVALLLWAIFVSTAFESAKVRAAPGPVAALAALAVIVIYPLTIRLLVGTGAADGDEFRAATVPLLGQGGPLWIVLQLTGTLLLGCITALLLPIGGRIVANRYRRDVGGVMFLSITGAIVTAASLSFFVLWLASSRERVSPYFAALWVMPFGFTWFGYNLARGSGRRLARWILAGMLAATALIPQLWSAQISARLRAAERDLSTLGVRSDPYLEYLLREFAREALARSQRGEDRLQLLYRSWVSSGLAREAYPARVTIWTADDLPELDVSLGESLSRPVERTVRGPTREPARTVPVYLREAFVTARQTGRSPVLSMVATAEANHAVVVPLENGRLITIEVPPRRSFDRATVLAPLLGTIPDASTQVELVPVRSLEVEEGIWAPMPNGWRSEALVHYPEGTYHAHLEVTFPSLGVRVARGLLLIAGNLFVFVLVWLLGRAARGEVIRPAGGLSILPRTLRARVTAALFAFFLLPTITFGYVAYRALAREVTRAARIVAERAAQQGVIEFPDVRGDLDELASHSGTEVLRYLNGELTNVSSEEAFELGLYSAWMPADVFLTFEYSEEEAEVRTHNIGRQEFLTAFRKLKPDRTGALAVPVSLQSAQTSERQREMAHMILFAALLGGLLSFALSLVVGRALTGPIGRLQRAAAAIGAGKLGVRLPEDTGGEFGRLNASFNRMVRQLRRARAREARTARVLAWGEMARQVAHEIKNPLTPIKLSVQHLRRAYTDGHSDFAKILNENVDQILVEIDRLSAISRAFSRYGAPPESAGPLVAVDVAAVVQESLTLYQTADTELNYVDRVERGLPPALSRPDELKEVILNLLENARNATEPGDTIEVTARVDEDQIEICVEDNGAGIEPEMLPLIFEPHFSTRSAGTGLGLAIVRRLVESWGGRVTAESETGRGTVVRVRLAIASEAVNYRGAR